MERHFEIDLDVEEPPDIHTPEDPPPPPPDEPTGGGGNPYPRDPPLAPAVFSGALGIFCFFGGLTMVAMTVPASGGLWAALLISAVFTLAYMATLWLGAHWLGIERRR